MRPRELLPRDVFDLREPVGEGRPNRPDDVATVERLLDRVGQPPFGTSREPTGLFSAPLRDSIRRFQRRNGLRDDGAVRPDGETLGTLAREIGFDDGETGRASTFVDPDGTTRRGRRCGRIAARLGNLSLDLQGIETEIESAEQGLREALDRVDRAAAAKARQPAAIVSAVVSIAGLLATGNLLLAATEAGALATRLVSTETDLNLESRALNQAANRLSDLLSRRDQVERETADLEAEGARLGCPPANP